MALSTILESLGIIVVSLLAHVFVDTIVEHKKNK